MFRVCTTLQLQWSLTTRDRARTSILVVIGTNQSATAIQLWFLNSNFPNPFTSQLRRDINTSGDKRYTRAEHRQCQRQSVGILVRQGSAIKMSPFSVKLNNFSIQTTVRQKMSFSVFGNSAMTLICYQYGREKNGNEFRSSKHGANETFPLQKSGGCVENSMLCIFPINPLARLKSLHLPSRNRAEDIGVSTDLVIVLCCQSVPRQGCLLFTFSPRESRDIAFAHPVHSTYDRSITLFSGQPRYAKRCQMFAGALLWLWFHKTHETLSKATLDLLFVSFRRCFTLFMCLFAL